MTGFSSEQNETDKMCQQIIEACKQQDSEKLISLFSEESKKNIENLDTEISAFFDYIEAVSKVLRAIVHHQVKATMVKGKRNWMYVSHIDREERYCMNFICIVRMMKMPKMWDI